MTVFQMRCFLEVARQLSFTEAAERMYISQSSLSRNISSIEHELGVKLFSRRSGAVNLTTAGRVLYSGLEKICDNYDSLCVRVEKAEMGIVDELRIGLLADQIINEPIARAILRFKAEWPDVNIVIEHFGFKELYYSIAEGKLDMAVGFKHVMDFDQNIGFIEIAVENVYMAIPKDYGPLPDILDTKELPRLFSKYQLYALSQESFPVHTNLPNRKASLIDGIRTHYLESVSALPVYVSLGLGATMVNESHILCRDPNVTTIPLDKSIISADRDITITKILCYNKNNMNMPTRRFLDVFSEIWPC